MFKKITMKKLRGRGEGVGGEGVEERGEGVGEVGNGEGEGAGGGWEGGWRGAYWIPASAHKVARLYHSVKVCKFFAHC